MTCLVIYAKLHSMIETKDIPSKRGRKPFGDQAMSPTERKRLSRSRKANEGSAEIMVRMSGGTLNFIDQFAQHQNISRTQVIETFLDMAIAVVANAVAEAELAMENGASEEVVSALMAEAFKSAPKPETIEKYKRVMGITGA